jgi:hypothetical protein
MTIQIKLAGMSFFCTKQTSVSHNKSNGLELSLQNKIRTSTFNRPQRSNSFQKKKRLKVVLSAYNIRLRSLKSAILE